METAVGRGADAAALGFGLVVALGFDKGGYFSDSWRWAFLGLAAVTAIALLARRRLALGKLERLSLGALAALAVWTLLSGWWGVAGTEAWLETQRCAVYVGALAALLAVVRRTTIAALLHGVLAGIVVLCAFALVDRLVTREAPDPFEGRLLVGPVGYANALGLLAAVGLVLALGLARSPRGTLARGASLAGAAGVCVVALGLTSSRGAELAAVVGVAFLVLLRQETAPLSGLRVMTCAALVGVVLIAGVATHGSRSLGYRPAYWRVAVEDAQRHSLLGSGAGSFGEVWLERRPVAVDVRDAHSLYLETLAELGVVGMLLVLGVFAPPLVATVRSRRSDRAVPAAAAGLVAYLVHAGLDWDWEMPVTTLVGLACVAALLVGVRPDEP